MTLLVLALLGLMVLVVTVSPPEPGMRGGTQATATPVPSTLPSVTDPNAFDVTAKLSADGKAKAKTIEAVLGDPVQITVEHAVEHRPLEERHHPGVDDRLGVDASSAHPGHIVEREAGELFHHEHAAGHEVGMGRRERRRAQPLGDTVERELEFVRLVQRDFERARGDLHTPGEALRWRVDEGHGLGHDAAILGDFVHDWRRRWARRP